MAWYLGRILKTVLFKVLSCGLSVVVRRPERYIFFSLGEHSAEIFGSYKCIHEPISQEKATLMSEKLHHKKLFLYNVFLLQFRKQKFSR